LSGARLTPGSEAKPRNQKNLPQTPQMEPAGFYITWVNLKVTQAYARSLVPVV